MGKIKVTQLKSIIGRKPRHRRTIEALGLGRISKTAIHNDTPQIRGMIKTVEYLVEVEEIE